MSSKRTMWTYYKNEWRKRDVRILGAASHATWLGSLVFDGKTLEYGLIAKKARQLYLDWANA